MSFKLDLGLVTQAVIPNFKNDLAVETEILGRSDLDCNVDFRCDRERSALLDSRPSCDQ